MDIIWARAVAVVPALWLLTAAAAQERDAPELGHEKFADTVMIPGGVIAEPAARVGFVPQLTPREYRNNVKPPYEGVAAVDLQTGKVLWTTKAATMPLLAAPDRLVALVKVLNQKHTLRLVVLDTSAKGQGKVLLASEPIVFAPGDSGGWLMSVTPDVNLQKGELLLRWQQRITAAGGVRAGKPSPVGTGTISESRRINLKTGRVEELPAKDWPAPIPLPKGVEAVKPRDSCLIRGWWRQDPLIVGKKVAVLAPDVGGAYRPVLRRWDLAGGKEDKPVVLVASDGYRLQVTPDRRYVFAKVVLNKDELAQQGLDSDWRVYSLETGQLVGRIPVDPKTASQTLDVGVQGSRAYLSVAGEKNTRFLKAHDLKSGKPLWTLRLPDKS